MEALTLPQDAAKLWAPTARAVADTLERYRCTPRIGGGTILTARFNGHRRSFDIDLKVSTHEAHRLIRAAKSPEIRKWVRTPSARGRGGFDSPPRRGLHCPGRHGRTRG